MEDDAFRQVAPGVFVNKKITVSIPHPDPCWIIENKEKTSVLGSDDSLLVFSTPEKAKNFMESEFEDEYSIEEYTWDDLVDIFSPRISLVVVDKENESGFYQSVPLQKGI